MDANRLGRRINVSYSTGVSGLPFRPAVGIMLVNDRGHVFVGQRLDSSLEAWQMPQGGIDPGETPENAAFRELLEETGTNRARILARSRDWHDYDLPAELQGRLWGGRYRGQRQKWFLMGFTGADADIAIETAHPEFRAWAWVAPDTLPDIVVGFKRPLYEAVLAEFAPLLIAHAA